VFFLSSSFVLRLLFPFSFACTSACPPSFFFFALGVEGGTSLGPRSCLFCLALLFDLIGLLRLPRRDLFLLSNRFFTHFIFPSLFSQTFFSFFSGYTLFNVDRFCGVFSLEVPPNAKSQFPPPTLSLSGPLSPSLVSFHFVNSLFCSRPCHSSLHSLLIPGKVKFCLPFFLLTISHLSLAYVLGSPLPLHRVVPSPLFNLLLLLVAPLFQHSKHEDSEPHVVVARALVLFFFFFFFFLFPVSSNEYSFPFFFFFF